MIPTNRESKVFIGNFESLDEVVKARKEAERLYHQLYIDALEEIKRKNKKLNDVIDDFNIRMDFYLKQKE